MATYTYTVNSGLTRGVYYTGISLAQNERITSSAVSSSSQYPFTDSSTVTSDYPNIAYLGISNSFIGDTILYNVYNYNLDRTHLTHSYGTVTSDDPSVLKGGAIYVHFNVSPTPSNSYILELTKNVTFTITTVIESSGLNAGRYNGSSYDAVQPYYYNGSAWVPCEWKRYNGSSWDDVDTM